MKKRLICCPRKGSDDDVANFTSIPTVASTSLSDRCGWFVRHLIKDLVCHGKCARHCSSAWFLHWPST